jgi:hypothetical protein
MLTLAVIGLALIVFLARNLIQRLASDHMEELLNARRASSLLVSRAEFIHGHRHIPVSLALGELAIYYESRNVSSSLDLDWIEDVEYDDDVVTGPYAGEGSILRLRCYGQAYEFLIPALDRSQWETMLPARAAAAIPAGAPRAETTLQTRKDHSRADDDGWPAQASTAAAARS